MNDILGYLKNLNKLIELLFVIVEKLWELGKMWEIVVR